MQAGCEPRDEPLKETPEPNCVLTVEPSGGMGMHWDGQGSPMRTLGGSWSERFQRWLRWSTIDSHQLGTVGKLEIAQGRTGASV